MKIKPIWVLILSGAVLALTPAGAWAQQRIVATVDGVAITETELALAEAGLRAQLPGLAETLDAAKRETLIDVLIGNQLMAAAAKAEGLASGQAYADRMRYEERRVLAQQWAEQKVFRAISPDEVRRVYDAEAAAFKPVEELRLRLIEVETREQADNVRRMIEQGIDFSVVARAVSANLATSWLGGDFGYASRDELKGWLAAVVFDLKPGQLSQPVKFDGGWMLLRVEDRRMRSMPSFEEVKGRIAKSLAERKTRDLLAALRQKANVVVPGTAPSAGSPR